jgi:hypothetical protein
MNAGFDQGMDNRIWIQATTPGAVGFKIFDMNNNDTGAGDAGFGGSVNGQYTLFSSPTTPFIPGTYKIVDAATTSTVYAYITFSSIPDNITVSSTAPA